MEMSINDIILVKHDIGNALSALKKHIAQHDLTAFSNEAESIESDFRLMCSYMLRGYKDPQLESVYSELLRRVFRLYGSIRMESLIRSRHSFKAARLNSFNVEEQRADIRKTLEAFVQDVALASLAGSGQTDSLQDIYRKHQRYVETLFNSLLVSAQWSEATSKFMTVLLLSPTVDQNDALLMISAIMLSLMNVFDVEKWSALLSVYENADDEKVRQRALGGWALTLPKRKTTLFPEVEQGISRVINDKMKRGELLQLQKQLFYCANAESDTERIQKEILPTLTKNSGLRASGSGFIEGEDDTMGDILGTEDSDAEIEKLERTMSQMMDMQQTGIDIYYGGFSHMKRFPFFYQLSNWFCPFRAEHPELLALEEKLSGSTLLDALLQNGPFCDSDKYSFAFAIASVIDKLPASAKEMLGSSYLGETMTKEQRESAAYVRRTYLQDLYRFFSLYRNRTDFDSPFAFNGEVLSSFFFANELFHDARMAEERLALLKFLYRQKRFAHIKRLWETVPHNQFGFEARRIVALTYLQTRCFAEARPLFEALLTEKPDDTVTLKGVAKTCFALHDFAASEKYYSVLVKASPDSLPDLLGLAVSQLNGINKELGMQTLFQLNYEKPDNKDVVRSLAWGFLVSDKAEKAKELYDRVLRGDEAIASDFLCAGYANWFLSQTEEALKHFRHYLDIVRKESPAHSLSADFEEDKALLKRNSISESERDVMLYLVEHTEI